MLSRNFETRKGSGAASILVAVLGALVVGGGCRTVDRIADDDGPPSSLGWKDGGNPERDCSAGGCGADTGAADTGAADAGADTGVDTGADAGADTGVGSEAGVASCGATPHGGTESRSCYTSASVPYGSSCSATTQTRTCDDGSWSPDYASCTYLTCSVTGAASCGATPHGGTETRTCYPSATVPCASSCSGTVQTRTCDNGGWSPDYPACPALSCSPVCPTTRTCRECVLPGEEGLPSDWCGGFDLTGCVATGSKKVGDDGCELTLDAYETTYECS